MAMRHVPVGWGVESAAHIEPFHNDRAVEAFRIAWPAYHQPGGEGRGGGRPRVPAPVVAALAREIIRGGVAGAEVFLDHVAERSEAVLPQPDRRGAGERTLKCNVGAHVSLRN